MTSYCVYLSYELFDQASHYEYYATKELAMAAVDNTLVANGWRLLGENDPLAVLL